MKKLLIGALVPALILFFWQWLSWGMIGVHQAEFQHTPEQAKILQALEGIPDGQYFLPTMPKDAPQEEQQQMMADNEGKPFALISYKNNMKFNMGMNMFRGLMANLLAALFLTWLLMQFANLSMGKAIIASLFIGLFGYLVISYTNHVWFETSSIGYLVDSIVPMVLSGLWLGWWLNK